MLSYLHKNVTVTWLNGEVSRGPDEVKAYYDRMMTGDKKVVQRIMIKPEVERLSDLYGDSAVAYGHSDDHFELTSGLSFDVRSRWSATLVKEDGRWKIVSFHASTGLFDNPLLNAAKQTAYWAGGIAAVVGLVAGFVLGKLLRKRA